MRGHARKAPFPRTVVATFCVFMPQPLKRLLYRRLFGWHINPGSYIGFSYILVDKLVVEENVRILHGNVIKGCEYVHLHAYSRIGGFNWITAPPWGWATVNTRLSPDRKTHLIMGRNASILHRHFIDCSDSVTLGNGAVLAGYRSMIVTHSLDIETGRARTAPVMVGENSLVFAASVLVAGAVVPNRCVVAAGGVVTGQLPDELSLYGGVPARKIKKLSADSAFFH